MTKSTRKAIPPAIACAVVGVLAVLGLFDSIRGFPLVFALAILVFGLAPLRHERPWQRALVPAAILALGALLAAGGWAWRGREIEQRQKDRRLATVEVLRGTVVPSLEGLEPLNTDRATWDEAAALTAEATLVTFWARWCSPCWKEMDELEELYREHKDSGLRVVAVTRYDNPGDVEKRDSDFAKAVSFLEDRDISYPAAITDRDDLYAAYRVPTPPALALVDENGKVLDYAITLENARSLMSQAARRVGAADPD